MATTIRQLLRRMAAVAAVGIGIVKSSAKRAWRVAARMKRTTKRRLAIVAIVVTAVLLLIRPTVDLSVGAIYKNVREPVDGEMPVTVTMFRSSADMISNVGGQGEGLNCSLPRAIDFLFPRRESQPGTQVPVRHRFRQACVFHDLCYRHGLATYGYSQNDCDQLLQEQAFRICLSSGGDNTLDACQLDAKKVTAGVKAFGFRYYHSWGQSTYFEFDPNPYRARQFSTARVISHPFKPQRPELLQEDPNDLLLRFNILRGGVRFVCTNCLPRKLRREELELGGAYDASNQLMVGLQNSRMNEEKLVWLPAGRLYSAPHIVTYGDGHSSLLWATRESFENTNSCIAVADAKNLMTHTRPDAEGCSIRSNHRLALGMVDLRSSSLQLSILSTAPPSNPKAPQTVVMTGLTFQKSRDYLDLCISNDLQVGQSWHEPACHHLGAATQTPVDRLRRLEVLQNFPIVSGAKHIYLSRMMFPHGKNESWDSGRVIGFDLSRAQLPGADNQKSEIKLDIDTTFTIADDYDPMMPLFVDNRNVRLVSARVEGSEFAEKLGLWWRRLRLYETDLKAPRIQSVELALRTPGSEDATVPLHASWARRPILIFEAHDENGGKKTQLLLSRSIVREQREVAAESQSGANSKDKVAAKRQVVRWTDETRLEFAIFERAADPDVKEKAFRLVRGLRCSVTYSSTKLDNRIKRCERSAAEVGSQRATPATLLQGAQLLVGRFTRDASAKMALVDSCMVTRPLILEPMAIGRSEPVSLTEPGRLRRVATCQGIDDPTLLAAPMRLPKPAQPPARTQKQDSS